MKTNLLITGMTCQNCVNHVQGALNSVIGVERATVDLSTGIALVYGHANESELVLAVREAGYEARIVA